MNFKKIICAFAVFAAVLGMAMLPASEPVLTVYADQLDEKNTGNASSLLDKKDDEDSWGWRANLAKNLFDDMPSVSIFGIKINFMNLVDSTKKLLLFNGEGIKEAGNKGIRNLGADKTTLWSIAKKINAGLSSLSVFLLVAMFFMELFETTLREAERISWERVVMIFIKLYFWRTIASESFSLVTAILNSGDWVYGVVLGKAGGMSAVKNGTIGHTLGTLIHEQGQVESLISIFVVLVFWTLVMGTSIAVLVQVFQRAFKIIVYTAFAPIPISLCANEHTANTGKRYIMNFFAVAIEAGIILLLTYIYSVGLSSLQSYVTNNIETFTDNIISVCNVLFGIILLNTIYAGTISASTAMSREIIGM